MEKNKIFDINSFITPDASYSPVYVWVWNDVCNRSIIDDQLEEMLSLGIRAFYILPEPENFRPESMPTFLSPAYLSEEYFELCLYAVKKANELGMRCWIYDEGGWPSGGACGRVLRDHPEYARQVLRVDERQFSAGDVYERSGADILAAFSDDKKMLEDGFVFLRDTAVSEYSTERVIYGNADYPDLLNSEATDHFIEITHKRYASSMKDRFSESISAVFTDEPKAPLRAFNAELSQKYEDEYGESVLPYLPLLAGKEAPSQENVHILYRWYDLCSRVFCENFLLPCKRWANDNGIAFTGHMDKDHDPLGCIRGGGNFNLMRALRCFDIPGVDVIHRQLYPENSIKDTNDMNGYNGFFPRYASSAAAQNGTNKAVSEIFGVAGPGLTYDIMRYTIGYQAVRGINIFNLFNFPLGRKGVLLAQELPVFTEKQIYYKNLGLFNRYTERLSYTASLGSRVCETGLYYPVHDFVGSLNAEKTAKEFDTLGRTLEDMMVDFDIVDDDVIVSSSGADEGTICIGNAVYRHLIIPKGAYIPEKTKKVLKRFTEGGGKVSDNASEAVPVIHVDGSGLRAMRRKTENGELLLLFREKGASKDYRIHLPSSDGYLLDLYDASVRSIHTQNGILELSLETGESAVILLTKEHFEAEAVKEYREKADITDELRFYKETELVFGETGFENITHPRQELHVNTGDWSEFIGSAYSGSGVYETSFAVPDETAGKQAEIDLGEVHYMAQLTLNGYDLGTVLMPPYRFKIPEGVLRKENSMKITVTNTSASLYAHTDYFNKRKTKELSPYFEAELNYARDMISGGLYGPVTLYI